MSSVIGVTPRILSCIQTPIPTSSYKTSIRKIYHCPCRCLSVAGPSTPRRISTLRRPHPGRRSEVPTTSQYRPSPSRLIESPTPRLQSRSYASLPSRPRQPRPLSDDPCPLPPGYTFYPLHNDKPSTPPTMAHIITSPHEPPLLPRSSVIQYLFPQSNSATKEWYKTPDPKAVAFIDGLTGDKTTREEVGIQAGWLAAGLKGLGLKKGDVGMTFGFNSLLYVNAIMGMQHLGCIVSPANAA
jgi:hypothetical protein